jgi:hypothetical protein
VGEEFDGIVVVAAVDEAAAEWVRDAQVECLAPGSSLGTWQVPLLLVFLTQFQGVVLG